MCMLANRANARKRLKQALPHAEQHPPRHKRPANARQRARQAGNAGSGKVAKQAAGGQQTAQNGLLGHAPPPPPAGHTEETRMPAACETWGSAHGFVRERVQFCTRTDKQELYSMRGIAGVTEEEVERV